MLASKPIDIGSTRIRKKKRRNVNPHKEETNKKKREFLLSVQLHKHTTTTSMFVYSLLYDVCLMGNGDSPHSLSFGPFWRL